MDFPDRHRRKEGGEGDVHAFARQRLAGVRIDGGIPRDALLIAGSYNFRRGFIDTYAKK